MGAATAEAGELVSTGLRLQPLPLRRAGKGPGCVMTRVHYSSTCLFPTLAAPGIIRETARIPGAQDWSPRFLSHLLRGVGTGLEKFQACSWASG